MHGTISERQRQAMQEQWEVYARAAFVSLLTACEPREEGTWEAQMQVWGRAVARDALTLLITGTAPRYQEQTVACACGGQAQYQRQRSAQVQTRLGGVTYERAYYLCADCHQGWCPRDQELGWCAGSVSRDLMGLVAELGAEWSFSRVADFLAEQQGVSLSPTTCQTLTETVGHWMHDTPDASPPAPPPSTPLYVSMDGVMVHDRDEGWKEMRVGSVYTTVESGEQVRAVEQSYVVDRGSVEAFRQRLWAEFARRGGEQAHEVVVIGDGATWIGNGARDYWPTATHIVDWYHAVQHLHAAHEAIAERIPEAQAWFVQQKQALWEGKVQQVLDALHAVAWLNEAIAREETYFVRHHAMMHYDHYRTRGLQIGSGAIESACKHVVQARCKQAGMRWSAAGSLAVATVRAVLRSGRFAARFAQCPAPIRTSTRRMVA